jgi:hypothetical protein
MLSQATATGTVVRGLFSLLCVPVKDSAGHIIGVLQVARRSRGGGGAPSTPSRSPLPSPSTPRPGSPTSGSGRGEGRDSAPTPAAFSRRDVVALEVLAAQVRGQHVCM